jgi:serine protease Do
MNALMPLSRSVTLIIVCSVGFGFSGSLLGADPFPFPGHPRKTPVTEVVKNVKDCVVNIHSERTVKNSLGNDQYLALVPSQNRVNGMGTGIIIDPRGYIITNFHVIDDVRLLKVRLSDGTSVGARILAKDAEADLALLKIDVEKDLPVIPLGTSSDLMVGETVIAIGNAFGYEHTVSAGVISSLSRDVVLNKEVSYKALIQTDASINPGNSGGPLLNVNGELIGVNVAIRAGAQGIAFAIPVDQMLKTAADMMSLLRRQNQNHGLTYHEIVAKDDDLETTSKSAASRRSLVIDKVEAGSPAAKAKLQKDDVVLKVGTADVTCGLELERNLLGRPSGDHVAFLVRREGKEQKLELVLTPPDKVAAAGDIAWKKLGLRLKEIGSESITQTSQAVNGGLSITEVRGESPASKAGIQAGDILVGLHQWEMVSQSNVGFVLNHPDLATFRPLRFYIIRDGQVHRGWIKELE